MTTTPEPKDKLDAGSAATAVTSAGRAGMVNGPEDEDFGWAAANWRAAENDVRRLRQRIFTASRAGDLAKIRNLQKLMLRSRANTLLSVRRVTEVNAGRTTPGVDGRVVLTGPDKAELTRWVHRQAKPWTARPVKRVYIPKAGGKQRPLGIPVIIDRVLQARVVNALEPEWEARFEPRSYGFRPGRGCHDAIEAIFQVAKGANPGRQWVLDADLTAALEAWSHCSFADCWGFEQGVLGGGDLDTQAFSASGAGEDGLEFAAFDLLQNGLAGDAESAAGVVEGEPAFGSVVDDHAA